MKAEDLQARININELRFSTTRSSGPGGQNVNKVNTKVELRFNIMNSITFNASEKELMMLILKNRINNEGDLLITSQSERTQLQNKKRTVEIFLKLIARALTVKPPRKATLPTLASKIKRLDEKRKRSEVKDFRRHTPEA